MKMKAKLQASCGKVSRRLVLAGLAAPAIVGCASRPQNPQTSMATAANPAGLDAVIDISHNVTVTDFQSVRRSNILAVIHKATEGGDWIDPSYGPRRRQAELAGLLWGAYHYGTRQYSGADQAAAFLSAAQPSPSTLIALDLEPNDPNPRNSMTLAQADAFVVAVQRSTGRWPMLYTTSSYAEGRRHGRRGVSLGQPIMQGSALAQCDLWLADHREEPEIPSAWSGRGWRLWQYAADQTDSDSAYGSPSKAVAGLTHCDRNLFNGNEVALYAYWKSAKGRV
jgi:lysozyme